MGRQYNKIMEKLELECQLTWMTQQQQEELFDTCLMTAPTYGMAAWANLRSVEMREIEKIQGMH